MSLRRLVGAHPVWRCGHPPYLCSTFRPVRRVHHGPNQLSLSPSSPNHPPLSPSSPNQSPPSPSSPTQSPPSPSSPNNPPPSSNQLASSPPSPPPFFPPNTPSFPLYHQVLRDPALKAYLGRTYRYVAGGALVSVGLANAMAYGCLHWPSLLPYVVPLGVGGLIMGFLGVVGVQVLRRPWLRHLSFWGAVSGLSVPLVPVVVLLGPTSFGMATALCATAMVAASAYAYRAPRSLASWEPILFGGLLGLVTVDLLSVLFGGSLVSLVEITPQAWSWLPDLNLYGGAVLFAGFTAFDTYALVADYRRGQNDALDAALSLYLNWANLLLRWARMMLDDD